MSRPKYIDIVILDKDPFSEIIPLATGSEPLLDHPAESRVCGMLLE